MKDIIITDFISSLFNIILNDNQKNNIINCLESLYKNNYINTEILLNLIKAFVVIFNINSDYSDIYYNILNKLTDKEKEFISLNIKKIKLSNQTLLTNYTINKIIYSINTYIINNYNNINTIDIFVYLFNVYEIINNYNISLHNMIQLYIIVLNNNTSIHDLKQLSIYLNKL